MMPARIAQRLRQMAERYPGQGYSLAHPDLHNTVFDYLGPADDWASDDDAQWSTFLLFVAEDVYGVSLPDHQTFRASDGDAGKEQP